MSISLADAQTNLTNAQAAYTKALDVQAAGIGDRSITRQRIKDLRDELQYWSRTVDELTAAASGSSRSGVRLATWS